MPAASHERVTKSGRVPQRAVVLTGVFMLTATSTTITFGQALPPIFDPSLRSGEPPAPLKREFKPPEAPPPSPIMPPIPSTPEPEAGEPFPDIRVFVRDIQVTGSTVFSPQQIDQVVAPYRNRTLTTEDLERLRLALTLLYVNYGYLTSGAILPDQDVTKGLVTYQIIEGRLTQIDVDGNYWFRKGYLRDRLELGVQTPVRLEPIQERLQLLQQDPRLERVNAELRPGMQRGESLLHLSVTEASPFKAWLDFNNYQTPIVGAERGLATVQHQNVTGNGDVFSFTYGRSSGVNPIIDTSYSLPLNRHDTTLSASYRRNDFLIVQQEFESLDINAEAEIFGLTLRQPVYRTVTDEIALSIQGERLYNKITAGALPGQVFQFIPGSSDTGVNTVTALRFLQEWTHRTPTAVIAARSRFSVGLNALDSTVNGGGLPDSQYFAWLGQLQAVRRFEQWGGLQVLGRMDLQLANDRLLPLEQVPVGGRYSVRGYRENSLVRDNAFLASVETRISIWRSASGEDRLQLAPFVDVGRSWNAKGETPDPETLAGIGVGLRWAVLPRDRAHFEVYWGQQLNHFRTGNGNLQDHGVHLQLVIQVL